MEIDPGRVGSGYIYCGSGRVRVQKMTRIQPCVNHAKKRLTFQEQHSARTWRLTAVATCRVVVSQGIN